MTPKTIVNLHARIPANPSKARTGLSSNGRVATQARAIVNLNNRQLARQVVKK